MIYNCHERVDHSIITNFEVKVLTIYNVETLVPISGHIIPVSLHKEKVMGVIPDEPWLFYIYDVGYNDFKSLYRINLLKTFFVIRSKGNLMYKAAEWKSHLTISYLSDAEIELTGFSLSRYYSKGERLLRCRDEE